MERKTYIFHEQIHFNKIHHKLYLYIIYRYSKYLQVWGKK